MKHEQTIEQSPTFLLSLIYGVQKMSDQSDSDHNINH